MKVLRYLLVLVLVLMLAAAGCGGNGDDPSGQNNDTDNGEIDENGDENGDENAAPEIKVQVTPPEGWEKEESSALIEYKKGPSTFLIVRHKVPSNIDGLDGYLEHAQEKLAETFSKMEFSDVESLQLDGHDSRKFFATYEVANIPFKLVIVYVYRDGYVYYLQGGTFAEDFDSLLPEFEAFIGSFRFE